MTHGTEANEKFRRPSWCHIVIYTEGLILSLFLLGQKSTTSHTCFSLSLSYHMTNYPVKIDLFESIKGKRSIASLPGRRQTVDPQSCHFQYDRAGQRSKWRKDSCHRFIWSIQRRLIIQSLPLRVEVGHITYLLVLLANYNIDLHMSFSRLLWRSPGTCWPLVRNSPSGLVYVFLYEVHCLLST